MDKEKLAKLAELFTNMSADDEPEPVAEPVAEKPAKIKKERKKREYTADQKKEIDQRMAKMREISLAKRQATAIENKNNKPKKVREISKDVIEMKSKMSDIDILKAEINELKTSLHKSMESKQPITENKPVLSTPPKKEPVKEQPKPIIKLPPPPVEPPKPEPSVRDILNLYGKRKRPY